MSTSPLVRSFGFALLLTSAAACNLEKSVPTGLAYPTTSSSNGTRTVLVTADPNLLVVGAPLFKRTPPSDSAS